MYHAVPVMPWDSHPKSYVIGLSWYETIAHNTLGLFNKIYANVVS